MRGEYRCGWETTFEIKRSDFGMKHLLGPVGDDVRPAVSVEGVRQTPGPVSVPAVNPNRDREGAAVAAVLRTSTVASDPCSARLQYGNEGRR